jgi:hypothetical protein
MQQTCAPLLAFSQLGNQIDRSLEKETELAEILVLMTQISSRELRRIVLHGSPRVQRLSGFQVVTPYICSQMEEAIASKML